jgi:hypothetical protein
MKFSIILLILCPFVVRFIFPVENIPKCVFWGLSVIVRQFPDACRNRRSLGPLRPPIHPASRRFQGGTATPSAPRSDGTASSSPRGEAVIMMDALRAISFSGGHSVDCHRSHATARSGRGTVREERDGAAGDEEPATKSRASSCQPSKKTDQGDGASGTDRRKWSQARSTVNNLKRTENQ